MPKKVKNIASRIDWRITITAIIVVAILEGIALVKEVDGKLFAAALAIIAGLAGFKISKS